MKTRNFVVCKSGWHWVATGSEVTSAKSFLGSKEGSFKLNSLLSCDCNRSMDVIKISQMVLVSTIFSVEAPGLLYEGKGQEDYSLWIIINFNAIPFLSFTIDRKFFGRTTLEGMSCLSLQHSFWWGIKSIIQFVRLSKLSLSCHRDGQFKDNLNPSSSSSLSLTCWPLLFLIIKHFRVRILSRLCPWSWRKRVRRERGLGPENWRMKNALSELFAVYFIYFIIYLLV